jgi:SAM-dependent methyltransferase
MGARKADYGIDSPGIVVGLLLLSALFFGATAAFPPLAKYPVRWINPVAGVYFLQGALGMLYYSKVGKIRLRERLLTSLPWRGDEGVLDVGCGRGLFLVGAAKRLTTGLATGVDLWVPGAVTGNSARAVLDNAAREGVGDRVVLTDGDARRLPFADDSFDVVVSNFVLHEVSTRQERGAIVREIVRVLRPGGRFLVVDFIFTREGTDAFRGAGASDARRSRIGGLGFWIGAIFSLGANQLYQITGARDATSVS